MIAGIACTKNIFLSAVRAPKIPAMVTQPKKKSAIFDFQKGSVIKKLQISPAAKKPLYKPWLAASGLVGSNSSGGNFLNIFLPFVVHANISNHRK